MEKRLLAVLTAAMIEVELVSDDILSGLGFPGRQLNLIQILKARF